jgi:hypothetical protein
MNFTFYPQTRWSQSYGYQLKLVPQLPIPINYNSIWTIGEIKSTFDPNFKLFEEEERQLIKSFICPTTNVAFSEKNNTTSEGQININSNFPSRVNLNEVALVYLRANNTQDHREQTAEVQSDISIDKDLSSTNFDNFKSFPSTESDCANTDKEKVPSKEDLYNLSVMIQNTNPDFQNILSSDLKSYLDECTLTRDGLYVSKVICGFDWWFEIYFEKNNKTNRNRRLLKCKHNNCGKIFKKAWNLFDHMRIHTGK